MYCCVYIEQCDAGLIELFMLTQQNKIQTVKIKLKGPEKNNLLKNCDGTGVITGCPRRLYFHNLVNK